MPDFPLMLRVKLPVVNSFEPQNNKFATGVENKATGDSKLNDSPGDCCCCLGQPKFKLKIGLICNEIYISLSFT